MAKKQLTTVVKFKPSNITRKGVHSKTRQSALKTSKYYTKKYRGQGR